MKAAGISAFDLSLLNGFSGMVAFTALRAGRLREVPDDRYGIYAVVRPTDDPPEFLTRGACCGKYGPPISLEELVRRWVVGSRILYFGKAGGPEARVALRSRVRAYSSFGLGKRVSHGGGRAIWQLRGADSLLVCWLPTPGQIPLEVEQARRARFLDHYRELPFANRQQ
jgi:hypothetical protein